MSLNRGLTGRRGAPIIKNNEGVIETKFLQFLHKSEITCHLGNKFTRWRDVKSCDEYKKEIAFSIEMFYGDVYYYQGVGSCRLLGILLSTRILVVNGRNVF
jgi:hypothetical protein